VAKKYGVHRTTLQYWLNKDIPAPGLQNKGCFKRVFTPGLENKLRVHAVTLQKMFYGVTGMDIRKLAFDFAEANHLQHPFNHKKKMAGPDWLVSFMKPSNLSLRTPEATNMTRVAGFTRPEVMRFFEMYKSIRDKHKITEGQIFNIDETGVSTVQTPRKIVAQRGMKQAGRITSAERGKDITVVGTLECNWNFHLTHDHLSQG
jgi:hypothetical protein